MAEKKYSTAELKAMLEAQESEERKEKEGKRKKYEDRREKVINTIGQEALELSNALSLFKGKAFDTLLEFRNELLEYGDLRRGDKNKGSFSIKNERYKIEVTTQVIKGFDERAELAAAKLQEFLKTFILKKEKATYELVSAATQRNEKTGSFDPDVINRLYKIEDKFEDQNWKAALAMFRECYVSTGTALYVRFYRKTLTGKWKAVILDFAALDAGKEDGDV